MCCAEVQTEPIRWRKRATAMKWSGYPNLAKRPSWLDRLGGKRLENRLSAFVEGPAGVTGRGDLTGGGAVRKAGAPASAACPAMTRPV
jgi:hypothetical protein